MKRRFIYGIVSVILLALFILGLVLALSNPIQQRYDLYSLPDEITTLQQNWTDDIRQQINFTSFGSRLMPYSWFINLEVTDSEILLGDDATLEKLGFIPQQPAENNPDGLPVGFARDRTGEGDSWIGLTCSACHAGRLTFNGRKMHIDGGPGLLNFAAFEQTVYKSLKSTLVQPDKFERFAKRLGYTTQERKDALISGLKERVAFFDLRLAANKTDVPYGYGRLDAFGHIFNAVAVEALNMPENAHAPDAPVSIPVLWDASHLDLVQWNASAINTEPGPLGQNATTALAVYGQVDLTGKHSFGYDSSIRLRNLSYIQSQFYKLQSPLWPVDILGELDKAKVAAGERIYRENCLACHELIDRADPHRKLKASVIALDIIGTDPKMTENFTRSRSKTGVLEGAKSKFIAGERFGETVQTIDLVLNAVTGAMIDQLLATIAAIIHESRDVYSAEMNFTRDVYKARSLNGVWASAPYLHNGSVPTLYDLMLPVQDRPKTFYVGSREVDVVNVGLRSDYSENASLYDTTLEGNSNAGHEFGAALSDNERWALIEFLKSL